MKICTRCRVRVAIIGHRYCRICLTGINSRNAKRISARVMKRLADANRPNEKK